MKNLYFNYTTRTGMQKDVILFGRINKRKQKFLVEVNQPNGMADKNMSYYFDTYELAEKKYNSIIKRVSKTFSNSLEL